MAVDLFLFPVMSSDCSMVAPAGDGAGAVVKKALRAEGSPPIPSPPAA